MKNTWFPAVTLLARYVLLAALVAVAIVAVFASVECFPVDGLLYWRDRRR